MTPKEYVSIRTEQLAIIEAAEDRIAEALELAEACKPPPKNKRRPAEASDIVEGAIIWYERSKRSGGDYWRLVVEVLRPNDPFKAFEDESGCRYGLDEAYVEIEDDA